MKKQLMMLSVLGLGMLLVGAGCASSTTENSSTNQPVGQQGNQQAQPGTEQGPRSHYIQSATSSDGLTWTKDGQTLLTQASVPIAIVRDDGSIVMYYVDASEAPENVNAALSTDGGKTFVDTDFVIKNFPKGMKSVDPTIVKLDDGRYRLYYFGSENLGGDPASVEGDHHIYSAISDDGIIFTHEQSVFAYPGLVDPDVAWNGSEWMMYVMSHTDRATVVATSTDGLNFTYAGKLPIENFGAAKPVLLPDGTMRMYGFEQGQGKQNVFYSYLSKDGGKTWTKESGERLKAESGTEITDAQVVQLKDGTWKMFYKISAAPVKK